MNDTSQSWHGISQLSQRFVQAACCASWSAPEYQTDDPLHEQFLQRIERAASEYTALIRAVLEMQRGGANHLSRRRGGSRKKVQQTARSCCE